MRSSLYDKWFVGALLCIVLMGLMMMTSASIVLSDKEYHQPFYFLIKQSIFLALGISVGIFLLRYEMKQWEEWSLYALFLVLFLLTMVLVPGIGHAVNGSSRWLGFGPLTFQVSEMAKFIMVLYMAGYLVRHGEEVRNRLSGFIKPTLILSLVSLLLLKEPDFGATCVIIMTVFGMLFLAGMKLHYFVGLLLSAVSVLGVVAVSAPYRFARLTAFLNPWDKPFDSGYQLVQSLIAFGRGGFTGVGLGQSVQKMFYLPEAHTDFLFAVIAEELGLVGTLFILLLFSILVFRIFCIGRKAELLENYFSAYVAYGIAFWFSMQFIVSIGVNSGSFPTKGLTLPLMSYGGSSLLITCLAVMLLFRIDYENRLTELGMRE